MDNSVTALPRRATGSSHQICQGASLVSVGPCTPRSQPQMSLGNSSLKQAYISVMTSPPPSLWECAGEKSGIKLPAPRQEPEVSLSADQDAQVQQDQGRTGQPQPCRGEKRIHTCSKNWQELVAYQQAWGSLPLRARHCLLTG